MPRRRGFFLHVALGFVLLFSMFVFIYFNFMQGQTQLAKGLLAGEVATQLAQAGVSAGIGYFSNTKQPSKLHGMLVTESPAEINGKTEELPTTGNPVLARLLGEYNGQATLRVELSLINFQPFYKKPESDSGIVYGQTEKFGTLKLVSTASYHGTKRRVVAFKLLKVVNAVPYVVSKFTLFAQERAAGSTPNLVAMRKVDLKSGEPDAKNQHAPVFFRHGRDRKPEESGWVYLGGGDYRLNLTWGAQGWGEQFQMLRRPWEMVADPSVQPPLPANFQTLLMHRGFFTGIKADNDLLDRFDFDAGPDPVTEKASVLHLFGAPPEANVSGQDVSPTYVLGQVYRRYLALRYVRKLSTRQVSFLPFAGIGDWTAPAPAPWPATPSFDVRGEVFNGNFLQYAQVMSQVVQESYNRAADFLGERQELDPPPTMTDTVRLTHRLPQHKDFLYEPSLNNGEIVMRTANNSKLFDGSLARIRMEDLFLRERAVFTMPADKFAGFLAAKKRRIPGILFFTGGDVDINQDLELDSGGIIAASGSITISGKVTVKPFGRPLVLASAGGDIKIAGSPRIEASLVALNGTIRREPGSPLDVYGNLVASTLDFDKLTAGSPAGKVYYDQRLDPTAPGGTTYAVYMGPSRDHYLAGQ